LNKRNVAPTIVTLVGMTLVSLLIWASLVWYWALDWATHKDTMLAVFFGVFAIMATAVTIWASSSAQDTLREIRETESAVKANLQTVTSTLSHIEAAEVRLEKDIENLEDATRRNLNGFHEIFARAYWLLNQAEEEIWYVNFLFGFGSVHLCNAEIADKYKAVAGVLRLPQTDYAQAVPAFHRVLTDRIMQVPTVRALVLRQDALKTGVVDRLHDRGGVYASLDLASVLDKEGKIYADISSAFGLRRIHNMPDDPESFAVYQTKSVPMQLLITQLARSNGAERKHGCLVFLVGTENVKAAAPRGFYTELDHVVEVYRSFAQGLIESSENTRLGNNHLPEHWPPMSAAAGQP